MAQRLRSRRGVVLGIVVAAVVVLLVAVELTARLVVSSVTEHQLEQNLPQQLSAEVHAQPTGVCVACELLGGGLSGMELSSEAVTFGGITGDAEIRAEDIRLGNPITVSSMTGRIGIGETELNALLAEVAAGVGLEIHSVQLREDGVAYETELEIFGAQVSLSVVANLEPRSGGRLRVVANSIAASTGSANVSLDLDPENFSFQACLAQFLPAQVQLTSVQPSSERLDVFFRSTDTVRLDGDVFQELGSCN